MLQNDPECPLENVVSYEKEEGKDLEENLLTIKTIVFSYRLRVMHRHVTRRESSSSNHALHLTWRDGAVSLILRTSSQPDIRQINGYIVTFGHAKRSGGRTATSIIPWK